MTVMEEVSKIESCRA